MPRFLQPVVDRLLLIPAFATLFADRGPSREQVYDAYIRNNTPGGDGEH